jgi:hypothetical protein
VILAAGLYLTVDRYEFSDFFVSWGFLAVIAIGGLSGGFFMPQTRKAIELAERDIAASGDGPVQLSAEFEAVNKRLGQVGGAAGLLIVLTIYVMTAQPFQ